MKFADTHGMVWQLCGKQTSGKNMAVLYFYEHHGQLAMLQCTRWLHSAHAAASLSRNLLLSSDRRPSQWWLRNHVSPCTQPRASDQTMGLHGLLYACSWVTMANWILVANTGKLNLNFNLNQTSNFQTSFNNPSYTINRIMLLMYVWRDYTDEY